VDGPFRGGADDSACHGEFGFLWWTLNTFPADLRTRLEPVPDTPPYCSDGHSDERIAFGWTPSTTELNGTCPFGCTRWAEPLFCHATDPTPPLPHRRLGDGGHLADSLRWNPFRYRSCHTVDTPPRPPPPPHRTCVEFPAFGPPDWWVGRCVLPFPPSRWTLTAGE